ncbi:hypothetical protein BKH45_03600 [Helicobacter sp. 11S03491-1]|nr:hypothetical protein BKH45_03600 [Helicobacter sp. 11S03491-1]
MPKTFHQNSLGTLGIANLNMKILNSQMPLRFLESISFLIELDSAHKEIIKILKNINLYALNEKSCRKFSISSDQKSCIKIFQEIRTQKSPGVDYLRIKFLELILQIDQSSSNLTPSDTKLSGVIKTKSCLNFMAILYKMLFLAKFCMESNFYSTSYFAD